MKLTDIAEAILRERYYLRDEQGKLIEDSYEEICRRVAKATAQAELLYSKPPQVAEEDFLSALLNLDLIPSSPMMMNAGVPKGQLAACISVDTPIPTSLGLKRMDQIKVGDEVLTHKGRFKKVTAVFDKGTRNIIRVLGAGITPDHSILSNYAYDYDDLDNSNVFTEIWEEVGKATEFSVPLFNKPLERSIKWASERLDTFEKCEILGITISHFKPIWQPCGKKTIGVEIQGELVKRVTELAHNTGIILDIDSHGTIIGLEGNWLNSFFYGMTTDDLMLSWGIYGLDYEKALVLYKELAKGFNSYNDTLKYQVQLLGRIVGEDSLVLFSDLKINLGEKANVRDISVEEDQSFVAGDLICHNCFVLPVEDDMHKIMDAVKHSAIVFKGSGGVGFDFSRLRPAGAMVGSTKGVSSGPVGGRCGATTGFVDIFDAMSQAVKQGGKRRGAMMGILSIEHPDILEFIRAKRQPDIISILMEAGIAYEQAEKAAKNLRGRDLIRRRLENFNVSTTVSDKFMQLVQTGDKKTLKLWNEIVESVWGSAEPGLIFIDTVNLHNPTPQVGRIRASNPCSESFLLDYESCVLGAVNLSTHINEDKINWPKLEKTIRTGIKFLDDIIDVNQYPLPEIEHITKSNRKIGLGVMGFAELLVKAGIKYGSKDSYRLAEELAEFITFYSRLASAELACERGRFKNYFGSIYDTRAVTAGRPKQSQFNRPPLDYKHLGKMIETCGVRNAQCTIIAPTGTTARIAGTSWSIEPYFSGSYVSHIMDKDFKEEISLAKSPAFVTAHELSPLDHIKMVSAWQKYIDNGISKTINCPPETTLEELSEVIQIAWKMGLKGITCYRDSSRDKQVLEVCKDGVCAL